MGQKIKDSHNWPDMFVGLYERLTGDNAEISYNFDDFEIDVPASTDRNSPQAHWKFNGTLRVTTRDTSQ